MASIDFAAFRQPLADDDPCGPDLDFDGDMDYFNFIANAEVILPESYFYYDENGEEQQFDRASINFDKELGSIEKLLERTRDLRLLTLAGRFLILNRDLASFAQAVETVAELIDKYWEEVHPRAEGGSLLLRSGTIATLDAMTVIVPLQYAPLCQNRRISAVTYRARMFTTGDAKPREGEATPTEATLIQALREAEEESLASRANLELIRDSIARIKTTWTGHGDMAGVPSLDGLVAIVKKMIAFIDAAFPRADASAGDGTSDAGGGEGAGTGTPGSISTVGDIQAALAAAMDYFRRREPSSPVIPLVAQAQDLVGKSFLEVLQILLPNNVAEANYRIGNQQYFNLPVERLSSLMPGGDVGEVAEEAPAEESSYYEEPAAGEESDSSEATDEGQSESSEESSTDEEIPPESGEAEDAASPGPAEEEAASGAAVTATPKLVPGNIPAAIFTAATRAQAMNLLDQVATFLRISEPASPIPWLIECARPLADRDFLTVLRSLLPPAALNDINPPP